LDINATLLGQTLAMLIFVWFCMKYIWPPIMTAIEERQKEIAEGLAAAEDGRDSLNKAEADSKEIINEARKKANLIVDQAQSRANEIISEGKADGVKERDRQLAAAGAEVEQEKNRAREELRGQVSAIAIAGAEKILEREIDAKAHEEILNKLASEL